MLDAAFERATLYRTRLKRLKEINQPGYSYWYECTSRHFTLALTPLSVADKFKELMAQKPGSWIFTSATLSVNDDLHHFTSRLGIEQAESLLLPSPFDYSRQALLCVPRNLPQTNQPGSARQLAAMLRPIIEANNGRCFMLCTSHAMMRDLAEQFRATMTLPVLLQGETSKGQLLQQFVSAGNALLVATSSFWEGVDVRGDTLSLVIIDKLPFTSPDDPLYWRGEQVAQGIRHFATRLAGVRGDAAVLLAAQAIRAVALGVVVTALVQAVLGGIGLAVSGVPYATLLTVLMILSCLVQLGPLPVLIPAIIWLYWTGDTTWGTVLLVWSGVVGTLDNVIRPMLIRMGADYAG